MRRLLPLTLLACLVGCGGTTVVTVPVQVPVVQETTPTEAKPTPARFAWEKVDYKPIDAAVLFAEWDANPSAAQRKYFGEPLGVEIVATIKEFGVAKDGETTVVMNVVGDDKKAFAVAVVSDTGLKTLDKFKKGDTVKLQAVSANTAPAILYLNSYQFLPAK